MAKASDKMELEGVVTKVFPGAKFQVTIQVAFGSEHHIICSVAGKLRQNFIKIVAGDKVTIEVSPYDLNRGIITWRNK